MKTTVAETYDFFTVTNARKKIGLEADTELFTLGIGGTTVGFLAVVILTEIDIYDGYTNDFTAYLEKESNKEFYKKISVDFSDTKIKRRENKYGYLQYMDRTDSLYRCVIFGERLGAVLGDEIIVGRLCLSSRHPEVEKLDQHLFEFIENLRFDGSGKQLTALRGEGSKKRSPSKTAPATPQLSWRGQQDFEKYREYGAFKAFAFDPYSSRWGYYHRSQTPQGAIDMALRYCGKDEWKCELYAVGNTVVAGMSPEQLAAVIEQYKERDGPGGPSDQSAREEGFSAYLKYGEAFHYKVFVAAEEGAWAYRIRETIDSALQKAMKACRDHVKVANNTGRCRVYAVGDTVVWDMPEKERQEYIKAYGQ